MAEKFTRWDAVDYLKTEEDMVLYLDACLDEDPGDGSLIRAALNGVIIGVTPIENKQRRGLPPFTVVSPQG